MTAQDCDGSLQHFPAKAVEAYCEVEFSRLDRKIAMFRSLPNEDRDLLPEFEQRVSALAECIGRNANLLSAMAQSAHSIRLTTAKQSPREESSISDREIVTKESHPESNAEDEHQSLSFQVRRGFVLLARDWSAESAEERSRCYDPLIDAVEHAYREAARASRSLPRKQFRVLVPGAGAGRLPWELVRRGFVVEGCEASPVALLVGNYVLNNASLDDVTTIYPFVHDHCNVRSKSHAVRAVKVPDVNPKDISFATDLSTRAGRFVEMYDGQDNAWDAVVSCMAFDLSGEAIEYVRRVAQILRPGGVWAFVGPLPCFDNGQESGFHLSVAEFMAVVRKSGFKLIRQDVLRCLHSGDAESLRAVHVECPFVVAVKVRPGL